MIIDDSGDSLLILEIGSYRVNNQWREWRRLGLMEIMGHLYLSVLRGFTSQRFSRILPGVLLHPPQRRKCLKIS